MCKQFSSDSLWTALNVNPIGSVQSRDLSPARDDVTTQQPFVATSYMGVRRTPAVLDITSCLQLLLEVYGQLLSVSAMPPVQPPLALYCEIVRSVSAPSIFYLLMPKDALFYGVNRVNLAIYPNDLLCSWFVI